MLIVRWLVMTTQGRNSKEIFKKNGRVQYNLHRKRWITLLLNSFLLFVLKNKAGGQTTFVATKIDCCTNNQKFNPRNVFPQANNSTRMGTLFPYIKLIIIISSVCCISKIYQVMMYEIWYLSLLYYSLKIQSSLVCLLYLTTQMRCSTIVMTSQKTSLLPINPERNATSQL